MIGRGLGLVVAFAIAACAHTPPPLDEAAPARLAPMVPSRVEVVQPPTPCDFPIEHRGAAVHVNPLASCVAGREFVAVFQSHFVALPDAGRWLLVSTAPADADPVPLSAWGFAACWLLVPSDPRFLHLLAPAPGGIVQGRHGRLVLRWIPPPQMVGSTLRAQMIWQAPGANAGQHLVGPMLRVTVGGA